MFTLARPLLLASNSPRRKELLCSAGFSFEVEVIPTDESYPETLDRHEVALHIARGKAEMFKGLYPEKLVLTADTVVIVGEEILGKPENHTDAFRMLTLLSGKTHDVVTAVSLLHGETLETFSDTARVSFRELDEAEINHYIEHYRPFDKAGAYGIQEWISMVGIDRIEGSFYTIMGLPIHLVYGILKPYIV